MRRDVHKVISERPKSGRTWESKTPRRKHPVLDPAGEQLDENRNHTAREHQKGRTQRLNVLERFLFHRVGRPWSKIYAEACEAADSRSFHGAEVREGLKTFVATECWLEGRTLMSHDWSGCPKPVRGLYVHPRSGLLSRNDVPPRT